MPRRTGVESIVLAAFLFQVPLVRSGSEDRLVAAARSQVGITVRYEGSYRRIAYPGGDIEPDRGVCSDVLVRAYRRLGIDLQVLVHDDMSRNWGDYPHLWGLTGPDPNIDHRRVPNLVAFLRRHGAALPVTSDPSSYSAGDIVAWRLPGGLPNIGIVSSRSAGTRPLVIHNIGAGAKEEDILFRFSITGHFRYPSSASGHGAGF